MADIIFKIYFILALSAATPSLISKQMREFISTSRIAQHIIGFVTVLILIDWKFKQMDFVNSVIYALIIYSLFVLSTKMDIHFSILFLILLGFLYYNDRQTDKKIMSLEFDKILDKNERDKIIKVFTNNKIYLIVLGLIGLFVGVGLYYKKKEGQYGGGFSWNKFLIN
jgi:predicted negative regulator of RcsB-dependent stress response